MEKLNYILTLFLISFSYAIISSAKYDDGLINRNLLLPKDDQEREETTTVGFAEIFPENVDAKVTEKHEPVDRPMKFVRFHPINRHFPASRLGSLRVPLRRCHHGRGSKPMRPRQMAFGDDMMVVSGENGDFDPAILDHQVPEQWRIRIHRHHRHHHHHHDDGLRKFPMGKHHDFFTNHRYREERDEEREEMHPQVEEQEWGFMRSIRKFLNGRI